VRTSSVTIVLHFFLLYDISVDVLHCRCVVLIPEESEDMWHAYNLISVRDVLKSTTIRFVFITVYVKRSKYCHTVHLKFTTVAVNHFNCYKCVLQMTVKLCCYLVCIISFACTIIQILTGAEVNTEKLCPEVM